MTKRLLASTAVLTGLLGNTLFADDDGVEVSRPILSVSQELTRVTKGGYYINTLGGLEDAWIAPTSGSIGFGLKLNQRLGLDVMVAGTYYSAPYHYDLPQNFVRSVALSTPKLNASYIFGDPAKPSLRFDAGIMQYKYNDYSRNLGEYMFRSWAYPGTVMTGGTYAYSNVSSATLTGLKFSQSLGMFSHDFIASIETEMTPVYDLNLTYMAKVNLGNVLKIGGGVQLARIYNANDDSTNNDLMNVEWMNYNGKKYVVGPRGSAYYGALAAGYGRKGMTADSIAATQAQATVDSLSTNSLVPAPAVKKYSAMAIKPMVHFSFDPKPLIGSSAFGPKDLVLYGEAIVLGVQNKEVFYEKLGERIPMMIGFNIPAFKLLDVMAVELEYYNNPWLPTYDAPQNLNSKPTPYMALDHYTPGEWKKDNLKWSVVLERTLVKGMTLQGQMASDHSRSWDWTVFGKTPWEIYTTPSQYYWSLKLAVKI